MKIGLISSCAPFVDGGGRFIVEWLHQVLQENGYNSEIIYIPSFDDPNCMFEQMTAFRLLSFDNYFDRVITFRPPAHIVKHRHKIVWFIHHARSFYDLWGTMYCPVQPDKYWSSFRANLIAADTNALKEARRLYTNSRVVSERLKKYNRLDSKVLYPPVLHPERFLNKCYGDEIVSICRVEHHKRQHILVEAMAHVKSNVKLRICGVGSKSYVQDIKNTIIKYNLGNKVYFENRWISENEKIDFLSNALAHVYLPFYEDSYGYPTIEAAWSRKATITTDDSGGVSEFVINKINGLVVSNNPRDVAEAFDVMYFNKNLAMEFGNNSYERLSDMGISWKNVLSELLQ